LTQESFVSLPARARQIPLIPFITLTTIGCALWALGLTLSGMIAASAWASVDSVLGHALLAVGFITLGATVFRRRQSH